MDKDELLPEQLVLYIPTVIAGYYKKYHSDYKNSPPYHEKCSNNNTKPLVFIFPKENSRVYLSKGFNGEINELVLKIVHTRPETKVHWYVDNIYIRTLK